MANASEHGFLKDKKIVRTPHVLMVLKLNKFVYIYIAMYIRFEHQVWKFFII